MWITIRALPLSGKDKATLLRSIFISTQVSRLKTELSITDDGEGALEHHHRHADIQRVNIEPITAEADN
jgi:hypothetical protein